MRPNAPRARDLAAAIRQTYEQAGMTQVRLAATIGASQAMVSRWARGEVAPDLDTIAAVEAACGAPRGHILRLAGYVDEVTDVVSAVLVDPALSPIQRDMLLDVYRGLLKRKRSDPRASDSKAAATNTRKSSSRSSSRRP
jgi:transcriptional regulator with XRE-family HTH domain